MVTRTLHLRRDFAEEMGLAYGLEIKAQKSLPKQVLDYAAWRARSPYIPPLVAYYIRGDRGIMTADGQRTFAVPIHFFEDVVVRHSQWLEHLLQQGVTVDAAKRLSIRTADAELPPICALHHTISGRLSFVEARSVLQVLRDQSQLFML